MKQKIFNVVDVLTFFSKTYAIIINEQDNLTSSNSLNFSDVLREIAKILPFLIN